ncbi:glycosyltransferase family 4 protein [Algoriphagus aquimarinus]|uniref:Glycosyltransferase family 4 protein n=1 Tax=Algoriphagus aquimarinus TaxID=237018 RepID=A0A5C7AV70_9BACT|nr:glycosyltransferase family 4 protein [Algoriphagus aquimarinus]TXE12207.1 glycosyltransferase family 4 protein [Algoriphagus aquimarinus]
MRILVVSINVAPWGGSEELWKSLAMKGLAQGDEVMVSVFAHQNLNPNLAELVAHGAILHQRPLPSYYNEQPFAYRALSELKSRLGMDKTSMDWRAVKAWKPEVVVISSGETFDHYLHHQSYLITYCKDNRVPFHLISQRNWEWDMSVDQEFRESRKRLIEDCQGFFFVSYQNYKMACSQLAMDIPKARIIQNPLKVSLESNLSYPKSGIPKMAYVARLETSIKGQDLFLQALSSPRFSSLQFELTFYGTGPDEKHLRDLVSYYGLEGKVFFGGHVADVSEIWRTHQLLVLCSLAEGTPLSLIEAMACGRTGLVTQVGDSAIWLSNSGFVVSGHQVENIQKALQEAIDNFSNWEKLGQQCKGRVIEKRDFEEIDGLLECVVGKRNLHQTGQDPEEFFSKMAREE